MSTSPQQLATTLAPSLEPLGLVIEDVTVIPVGKRRLVRVLVDRDLPLELTTASSDPVSLDEVTDATRVISDELDRSDAMGAEPYTLEVSSPGTDRPLVEPRHFVRNVGRLATLALEDGGTVSGRITSAGPDGLTITPEQGGKKGGPKASAQPQELNYTSITSAKVQVEFTRGDDAEGVGEDV